MNSAKLGSSAMAKLPSRLFFHLFVAVPRRSQWHALLLRRVPARLLLRGDERQRCLGGFFTEAIGGLQLNGKFAGPVQRHGERWTERYDSGVFGYILIVILSCGLGNR